jgi:DNA polymerase V
MKKILTDDQIGENLRAVITAMGLTQDEFAENIGKNKTHISGYIGNTGSRKAKNLLPELITMGVNGLWFLTGEGQMFQDEVQNKSTRESESEEALRNQAKVIQVMFDRGLIKIPPAQSKTEITTEQKGYFTCENCFEVSHYVHRVAAGLPADSTSPAEKISLPKVLVKHPEDTYALTVSGDSMKGAGIEEGDILVVDRAMKPKNKSIVIASINGEQTVKRLQIKKDAVSLMPENHKYPEISITSEMDFRTLGVVTWVIRRTV